MASEHEHFERPPKGFQDCKCIQLYVDDLPFIRTERWGEGLHVEILKRTLKEFGISNFGFVYSEIDRKDVIAPNGERYRMVGAGKMSSVGENSFELHGRSGAYTMDSSQQHLDDLAQYDNANLKINN